MLFHLVFCGANSWFCCFTFYFAGPAKVGLEGSQAGFGLSFFWGPSRCPPFRVGLEGFQCASSLSCPSGHESEEVRWEPSVSIAAAVVPPRKSLPGGLLIV
jgi:hypothetical protein